MPQPSKIPLAFAASGDKNVIPESTETTGLASWRDGFPAITSEPFAQGGVAPKRADFNGIFNALSLAIIWQQQGGVYAYDATTDYEVGNIVLYSGDLYKCITANGPNSAVKAPTDTTAWAKVILTPATTSAAGYMSAADKTELDALTNPTSFTPTFTNNIDTTQNNSFYGCRLGRIIVFTYWLYLKNATATWNGNYILTNMPHATGTYQFPSCNADNLFLDGYTTIRDSGSVYYVGRAVSVPAGKAIRGWGCYLAAD